MRYPSEPQEGEIFHKILQAKQDSCGYILKDQYQEIYIFYLNQLYK